MKKIIALFVFFMLMLNSQVYASDIEIQPTFYSRSNAQDRIWVGSFQLAWNDFINKIVFNPIRFREGTPVSVVDLNKQSFTTNDVLEKSYYKYSGKVRKNTKKQITKAIKKKFKESSDILDQLDLTARADMYLIYAMLKKDFEFVNSFDKLERLFGQDAIVEYFGINEGSNNFIRENVKVLFYNSSDDFAVKLLTKGEDEVYLYRNSSNKPFNYIYADMLKKQQAYKEITKFRKIDELKYPNLSISEEKVYDELMNKRVMGTNLVINQAVQSVKFDLNNRGVKIKSEAGITAEVTSLSPEDVLAPRKFYFEDTFVLFVKEKDKSKPYCALRVNDINKFQAR